MQIRGGGRGTKRILYINRKATSSPGRFSLALGAGKSALGTRFTGKLRSEVQPLTLFIGL